VKPVDYNPMEWFPLPVTISNQMSRLTWIPRMDEASFRKFMESLEMFKDGIVIHTPAPEGAQP